MSNNNLILPELEKFLETLGIKASDSDFPTLQAFVRRAIEQTEEGVTKAPAAPDIARRLQDSIIESNFQPLSSVLDLGCGDGDLLVRLAESRKARVQGVEHDIKHVLACVSRGVPVIQDDLECIIKSFQDKSFDYVILEETLQTLQRPIEVLDEILRVGRFSFVSFPNFAHWKVRLAFGLGGRMPCTEALPHSWYDTPNIHLCSVNDFLDWTEEKNVEIINSWALAEGQIYERKPEHNLTGEQVLFFIKNH